MIPFGLTNSDAPCWDPAARLFPCSKSPLSSVVSLYSTVLLVWDPGIGCVRCTKHKGYIGKKKASLKNGLRKSRAVRGDAKAEAWAPIVWFKTRPSLAHSWASSVLGSQFRTLVLRPSHGREVGFFFSSLLAPVHTMYIKSALFPQGFPEGDRYIFYKLFCWIFFSWTESIVFYS